MIKGLRKRNKFVMLTTIYAISIVMVNSSSLIVSKNDTPSLSEKKNIVTTRSGLDSSSGSSDDDDEVLENIIEEDAHESLKEEIESTSSVHDLVKNPAVSSPKESLDSQTADQENLSKSDSYPTSSLSTHNNHNGDFSNQGVVDDISKSATSQSGNDFVNHNTQHYGKDDYEDSKGGSSQPLKTLRKLQAMLEETDYATVKPQHVTQSSKRQHTPDVSINMQPNSNESEGLTDTEKRTDPFSNKNESENNNLQSIDESPEKLWTSKDRSKYRRQQRRLQQEREELIQQQQQQQQQRQSQQYSEDDESIATEDTDDGLGYTLPNLPVYLSDAEATDSELEISNVSSSSSASNTSPQNQQPQKLATRLQQQQDNQIIHRQNPPPQQGQGPPYQYHDASLQNTHHISHHRQQHLHQQHISPQPQYPGFSYYPPHYPLSEEPYTQTQQLKNTQYSDWMNSNAPFAHPPSAYPYTYNNMMYPQQQQQQQQHGRSYTSSYMAPPPMMAQNAKGYPLRQSQQSSGWIQQGLMGTAAMMNPYSQTQQEHRSTYQIPPSLEITSSQSDKVSLTPWFYTCFNHNLTLD